MTDISLNKLLVILVLFSILFGGGTSLYAQKKD